LTFFRETARMPSGGYGCPTLPVGNPGRSRGLLGGAEGIRTSDLRSAGLARLTGSSLPFLGGSSATARVGLSPTPVPAPCVASASNVSPVSTRTAWLPVAASKRRTMRVRARAKERVDDDVAAVGEIEKGVLAYMLKLRDRVVLV
jgi:hypothetical protein